MQTEIQNHQNENEITNQAGLKEESPKNIQRHGPRLVRLFGGGQTAADLTLLRSEGEQSGEYFRTGTNTGSGTGSGSGSNTGSGTGTGTDPQPPSYTLAEDRTTQYLAAVDLIRGDGSTKITYDYDRNGNISQADEAGSPCATPTTD